MQQSDAARPLALVTGSGSPTGIGFAVARGLASSGHDVVLTSTSSRCEERAAELRALGAQAWAWPADLTDEGQVRALLKRVHETCGVVAVLVNNAGMTSVVDPMGAPTPTHEVTAATWRQTLERNLTSAFLVTAAVLPAMAERRFGRIVNIASTTGTTGAMLGEAAYASAKAGMLGLTRTVALEYAALGITCNAVAPGWIATGSQTDDEVRQGLATPIGRSGTPGEVAHVVAMLCGAEAGYITGQCLVVDGGNAIAEERALR